ncbi:MAG: Spy0128 family protein [Ruminococcus sp.]
MINKKKLGAFVLAGTMLLSMGTTVFAAGEPTAPDVNQNGTVPITKEFEMADGLRTPAATFKFTATSTTSDALPAMITDVTYRAGETGTLKDGKYVISKNTAISFRGNWKHAGEYVYTVTESKENPVSNVTYDNTSYTLRVYVINGTNGPQIEKITAQGANGKTDKILFTNTYAKNDATLTIEKKTTGKYANKTKEFNFEITFTKSPMSDQTTFTGNIGSEPVECTAGIEKPFTLADGEQLVFHDLPVGTTYVVKELAAKDGYTPSVTVKENQTNTVTNKTVQETEALNTLKENGKNNLVGENENKVTFTNTYKDVAVTGIVMNNLPFILLVAVAIVAFVSLAVIKRRRTSGK